MSFKLTKSAGSGYEPVTPGYHDSVLCEIVDLGIQDTKYGPRHQAFLVFQVAELASEGERAGHRKEIRVYFSVTTGTESKPSKIRKMLQQWRGKAWSDAEIDEAGLDIDPFLSKPAMLFVVAKKKPNGEETSGVDAILPPRTQMEPLNYVTMKDREAKKMEFPPKDAAPPIPNASVDKVPLPPVSQAPPIAIP